MEKSEVRIFHTFVNNHKYLYDDAETILQLSRELRFSKPFIKTQLCRTAALLFILSKEALANQAMNEFLPEKVRKFVIDRETSYSFLEKWELLPLLCDEIGMSFDKSAYPWSHFAELIRLRNDYVHPKYNRSAFYAVRGNKQFTPLDYNDIPSGLKYKSHTDDKVAVKETDIIYRLTRLPKDPYSVMPEHVDVVKKVVDDITLELDRLLDGVILKDDWHLKDKMELIWPPGATLNED